jgi:glycosyltransferase involved in cell wall biosynthesis
MRILLAQNMLYTPTFGGANKSNRVLLEELAARGHECCAVASACGAHSFQTRDAFRAEMKRRGIDATESHDFDTFQLAGVRVVAAFGMREIATCFDNEMRKVQPDCVIVASEDPGFVLLRIAHKELPERIVYLARTTPMLPFGPDAIVSDGRATERLRRVARVVTVSEYVRTYMFTWGGVKAEVLPVCLNGVGPFSEFNNHGKGYVTIINPCANKGIAIFLGLAQLLPSIEFAAVPTWGTNRQDMLQLRALSNVRILNPVDDVEEILKVTQVLLVPSLWAEAKPNVITEAMLRGIPVLASDIGGNCEAMLGHDYLLPARAIREYTKAFDERLLPISVVPEQDLEPWRRALQELVSSPETYSKIARSGRAAALAANSYKTIEPLENLLLGLSDEGHARASLRDHLEVT